MSASDWSSILFTTYSLSLSFLESVPLSAVTGSYRTVTVVTDMEGYRSSLTEVGAIGIGREYEVVPVRHASGVFHPKIALMGDTKGNIRAMVGSGNLSFGGWGYNNEVLEVLRPGHDRACFADLADFLEEMRRQTVPGGMLDCLTAPDLDPFVDMARKAGAASGDGSARLFHSLGRSIVDGLTAMAGDLGGAEQMTVVSPFFSGHEGVRSLATAFGCEIVAVAVPPASPSWFDFAAAEKDGFPVRPVSCTAFNDSRNMHSKLLDVTCRRGRLIVSGSLNATMPAVTGRNVEAVVARVHERPEVFGWEATSPAHAVQTEVSEPEALRGPVIVVDYSGGEIRGRMIGGSGGEVEWSAVIVFGAERYPLGDVTVASDGSFVIAPPATLDPAAIGASAQIVMTLPGQEIRGWLALRSFLDSMSRRGPITRSLGRFISGRQTVTDLDLILKYITADPGMLLAASESSRRSSSAERKSGDVSGGPMYSTGSAFDMQPNSSSGAGASKDDLIEVLLKRLASTLPSFHADGEDNDSGGEAIAPSSSPQPPGKGGTNSRNGGGDRLVRHVVAEAFDGLFKMIETVPAGNDRTSGLLTVFDMMCHILPWSEGAAEDLPKYLMRWLNAAIGSRPVGDGLSDLDASVAAVASRLIIGNPASAAKVHGVLQSWFGGEPSQETIAALTPQAGGHDEDCLFRDASKDQWSQAWHDVMSTRTAWNDVIDLKAALERKSMPVSFPPGMSDHEKSVLIKVADGRSDPKRIAWMTNRPPMKAACPRCGFVLPAIQQSRIRNHRVASCDNFLCNRVVIDVSL